MATWSDDQREAIGKIYKQHCTDALSVFGGVNVGGISSSLHRAVRFLWDVAHEYKLGTRWVNRHPITYLYVQVMVKLSHAEDLSEDDLTRYAQCVEQLEIIVARPNPFEFDAETGY